MCQICSTQPNSVMRDLRGRETSTQPSLPMTPLPMEGTMFEALRRYGNYRVDYLNQQKMGAHEALGLYVLGDLLPGQAYSHSAKHNLMTGLVLVRAQLGVEKLVAVYVEVNDPENPDRPAYRQLKSDMRAGMFHRLLVMAVEDLYRGPGPSADWWNFYREMPDCEVLSAQSGTFKPVAMIERPVPSPLRVEGWALCQTQ